jgi:hypothetical protein
MMTMNGTERETAGSMLSILTLLPESDLAELVAIAISNDDAVDRAWVIEHWDLEWVLPLLAQFTATNPLGKYFEPLGKVLMNLQAQMPALQTAAQAPAPQANGTTPPPHAHVRPSQACLRLHRCGDSAAVVGVAARPGAVIPRAAAG